jgi:hypothetical protein
VAIGSTSEFGNLVSVDVAAANGAPQLFVGGPAVVAQGTPLARDGYFLDPDSSSWTAFVDYDDGSPIQPLAFTASEQLEESPDPDQYPDGVIHYNFALEHTYAEAREVPYQVTVTVIDNGQLIGIETFAVIVENQAPQVPFNTFAITNPAKEGVPVTLSGSFTDPGIGDTHQVRVDWGDGTVRILSSPGEFDPVTRTFSTSYVYVDDDPSNSALDQYRVPSPRRRSACFSRKCRISCRATCRSSSAGLRTSCSPRSTKGKRSG